MKEKNETYDLSGKKKRNKSLPRFILPKIFLNSKRRGRVLKKEPNQNSFRFPLTAHRETP